jgi:hypothetical protein
MKQVSVTIMETVNTKKECGMEENAKKETRELQRIMLMVFENLICKRQRGMKNKINVHKQNNR